MRSRQADLTPVYKTGDRTRTTTQFGFSASINLTVTAFLDTLGRTPEGEAPGLKSALPMIKRMLSGHRDKLLSEVPGELGEAFSGFAEGDNTITANLTLIVDTEVIEGGVFGGDTIVLESRQVAFFGSFLKPGSGTVLFDSDYHTPDAETGLLKDFPRSVGRTTYYGDMTTKYELVECIHGDPESQKENGQKGADRRAQRLARISATPVVDSSAWLWEDDIFPISKTDIGRGEHREQVEEITDNTITLRTAIVSPKVQAEGKEVVDAENGRSLWKMMEGQFTLVEVSDDDGDSVVVSGTFHMLSRTEKLNTEWPVLRP